MALLRHALFVTTLVFSSLSFGSQEDVRVLLRSPAFLFGGNQEGEVKFLTAHASRGNIGSFFQTDENHAWRYGIGFDAALISVGNNGLWRFGGNFDGLADSDNSVGFRIGQFHFEVFSAYEWRMDDDVFYIGHRHRCRHAADSTPSRIIMKTGPEIGYNSQFNVGPVQVLWSTSLLAYLYGQNVDLTHQQRLNLSSALQAEWSPYEAVSFFAGGGLSTMWVAGSTDLEYLLWSPTVSNEVGFSPSAAIGVNIKGEAGDAKLFASYDSVLDAGFHARAKQIHMLALNGEFWF